MRQKKRLKLSQLVGGFIQNRMTVPDESTRQRKIHRVDGYMMGTNLLVRTDRLSTFIEHATCQSLTGRCIGSKRRFVFRASPIYKRRLTLSFLHFSIRNCLSERSRQPCQSNPSRTSVYRLHQPSSILC